MTNIKIAGEYIKLDALLKLSGLVSTGGEGKIRIKEGEVKVNGETCLMCGKKIREGYTVAFAGETLCVKQ